MRELAILFALFIAYEVMIHPAETGDWFATFNGHAAGKCPGAQALAR